MDWELTMVRRLESGITGTAAVQGAANDKVFEYAVCMCVGWAYCKHFVAL